MRCPTGVLNGFPIKNSMMSAVRGPAKHRRLRAEPYATASGPAVSLSLSVSPADCCGFTQQSGAPVELRHAF